MEIKTLMVDLNTQFEEFKTANDAGRTEIVANIEVAMDEKQTQIDELKTAIARTKVGEAIEVVNIVTTREKAFEAYARYGNETEMREFKGMQTGVDADGGYLVPEILQNSIIELLSELTPMRGIANVMTLSGTGTFTKNVQTLNAAGGWIGEVAERINTDTPQFDRVSIPTHEVYANPLVSLAVLEDSVINLEQALASDVAGAIATLENKAFTTGSGIGQPTGLNAVTGTGDWDTIGTITATATGAVTGDELIEMVYDIKPQYRANAKFMMNRNTLEAVRKLKDGNDRYLFVRGQLDDPSIVGYLLGYPVIENEECPDMATGTLPIYFGDFNKGYQIVDRVGLSTLRNPYKVPGQVEFYTRKRVGGGLADGNALRVLVMA